MAMTFNADEIFELAEQIERNGAKFYNKAAEYFDDPKIKAVLGELAKMEHAHLKTFSDMRASLSRKEWEPAFDLDDQAGMYLRAFADGHIFKINEDPSEKLSGNESFADILHTAIALEKDSVIFYLGVQEMVPDTLGKNRLQAIIREEMRHISELSGYLQAAQ